ncbi:MAG: hypothetical protein QM811_27490 [Pirellulales bacterium]
MERSVVGLRSRIARLRKMPTLKIIIEKHEDGYVAYPLGLKGIVIGQGDTYDEALRDVRSAVRFHIDSFGSEVFEEESPVIDAYVADLSGTT